MSAVKKVYIVGGDGFARECYIHLQHMREWDPTVEFAGFLGHGGYGHTVNYKTYQKFYLGEVADHEFKEDEHVVIGAGYPDLRRKIYNDLKPRGIKFINLMTSPVLDTVTMGEANVIADCGALSPNVTIGSGNVLNGQVMLGHDDVIGDFNFLGPRCMLQGYVSVGSDNVLAAGSMILAHGKMGNGNKLAPLSVIYRGCKNNAYMMGNPALKVGDVDQGI